MCTVSEWSTEEVCLWLRELDLDEHSEAFKTHDIQGRELLTLARDDLKVSTLLCSDLPYLTLPYLTRKVCYRLVLRPPVGPMRILKLTL